MAFALRLRSAGPSVRHNAPALLFDVVRGALRAGRSGWTTQRLQGAAERHRRTRLLLRTWRRAYQVRISDRSPAEAVSSRELSGFDNLIPSERRHFWRINPKIGRFPPSNPVADPADDVGNVCLIAPPFRRIAGHGTRKARGRSFTSERLSVQGDSASTQKRGIRGDPAPLIR